MWLIKPELAESKWRTEEGEERSREERNTYPGSRQELGHGCRNGSCCSSWSVHSSTGKTTELSPSHAHLCYLSHSYLSLFVSLAFSSLLSPSSDPTPSRSRGLHPYLMSSFTEPHVHICRRNLFYSDRASIRGSVPVYKPQFLHYTRSWLFYLYVIYICVYAICKRVAFLFLMVLLPFCF